MRLQLSDQTLDKASRNKRISITRQSTLQRHKAMRCKTYALKIDKSHLSDATVETFTRLFLEAKWLYNHLVASDDVFHADYKSQVVKVKSKEGRFEAREIRCLSAQMRQGIIERTRNSILSLSGLKRSGHPVGKLKFKSRVGSIPLKQYGKTYRIGEAKVKIEKVRQLLRVRGADQIPSGVEFTSATLEQRDGGYFIHVTTYQEPVGRAISEKAVGIDAGIKHQLTLSNGLQLDEGVSLTKRIRRLHRELSRRTFRGKNWSKTNARLNMEYGRITDQRDDVKNKIVSKLITTYNSIAIQDDNIFGWQRMWGRKITTSAIGGIMSDLKKRAPTPVVVGRFVPTTQKCSGCEALNEIGLGERIYRCDRCGLVVDRDLNAAINDWKAVPAVRRESTPVDTKTATELMGYFNGIPRVSASLVEEAGSRPPVTETTAPADGSSQVREVQPHLA